MVNRLEAVIFDMDRTLVDSNLKLGSDVKDTLARLGTSISLEEAKASKDWVGLAAKHGHSKDEFWNSFNQRDTWTQSIQKGIATIFPETFQVLDTLQRDNYRLVLVSRSEEKETMEKVNGFGFGKYFKKPYLVAPRKLREQRSLTKTFGYLQAIDQEGLVSEFLAAAQTLQQPARLYIIGDSEEDVWAGQALKKWISKDPKYQKSEIITILVDRQAKNPKTRADYVVRDLNQALDVIKSYRTKS